MDSQNKQKNRVFKIQNLEGRWVSSKPELKKNGQNHFAYFFKTDGNRDFFSFDIFCAASYIWTYEPIFV